MKRSEKITRDFVGKLGRIPRKRKKVIKRTVRNYIQAEIDCGNWDAIDYQGSPFTRSSKKEYDSYGHVPLIN